MITQIILQITTNSFFFKIKYSQPPNRHMAQCKRSSAGQETFSETPDVLSYLHQSATGKNIGLHILLCQYSPSILGLCHLAQCPWTFCLSIIGNIELKHLLLNVLILKRPIKKFRSRTSLCFHLILIVVFQSGPCLLFWNVSRLPRLLIFPMSHYN